MIDLHGVARHLRLSVDQLRAAADLLQQGYHPAFIERYRADETGALPRSALWTLKLEIDRQQRLIAARQRAKDQLPKDAELDEEAAKYLERATTEVEIDATLKAFRARRVLQQSQERDSQAGHLLEMLIAYDGPKIEDVEQWVSDQLGVDKPTGTQALQQTARLISSLIQCDTPLTERLRRAIQRKATVRVELCSSQVEEPTAGGKAPAAAKPPVASPVASTAQPESATPEKQPSEAAASEPSDATAAVTAPVAVVAATAPVAVDVEKPADEKPAREEPAAEEPAAEKPAGEAATTNPLAPTLEAPSAPEASVEGAAASQAVGDEPAPSPAAGDEQARSEEHAEHDEHGDHGDHGEHGEHGEHGDDHGHSTDETSGAAPRSGKSKKNAKMTPRQRRRRWLISMLQPMKTLKRPLSQLTAYQQLMLGRGRRSQLVKTHLEYDLQSLVSMARDAFVNDKHPLARWFEEAVRQALENSTRARIEADAIADLEEIAQEKLLETSADQLRQHLMRRPVRGHTIMLVDTVGPKVAAVVVINPQGEVLAIEELPCSAQAEIVNQNVVKLGELAHKHRVTLVALTNGPARRFLVLTLRELMKQSANSGLRWTMADRGGAEAYAAGRVALKELSAYNRRDRAAIWIARSLQNPLAELLKVDVNRMRLGSYQRELPQDSLKKLVQEVISDCVCSRGIDARNASMGELLYVPGIQEPQARQIVELAAAGNIKSRAQLCESVNDWSEVQMRQAIGWLRVFGSDQPLDATAIHPEDYHLAQRLIDNSEFTAPANAPENWSKRLPAQPTPGGDQNAPLASEADARPPAEADAAPQGDAVEAAAHESQASESQAGENQAGENQAGESQSSDIQAGESQAGESQASESPTHATALEAAALEATASEATASEATASEAAAAGEPTVLDEAAMSFKSSNAAELPAAPSIKPEYPEDIATAPAAAGPDIDVEKLARSWQVGREKLRWIAGCLNEPFADSRLSGTPIPLRTEMPTLASLEPEMCVWAVVVGVADFGAFVEISPDCSGLIHISRLSAAYVEDPHQSVQVGDLLLTWVVATDQKKNRVALTALSPAERAALEAAGQERREQQRATGQDNRSRGGQRRSDRPAGAAAGGEAGSSAPTGERGRGGQRGSGGRAQGGGGRGHGGGQGQGRGQAQGGRGRGRGAAPRPAKTVVVTSKKPKAPISEAMKEGEEPLRSFSDLLQFYEAKRTDEPAPPPAPPASPADE